MPYCLLLACCCCIYGRSFSSTTLSTYCLFVMAILLDGGFSSQVKIYNNNDDLTDNPLWTAQCLVSNQNGVLKAHSDYVNAGCDIITTNTYQASVDGFQKHLGLDYEKSISLIKGAVDLARQAIKNEAKGRTVLVAGSVSAYGACLHDGSEYRGEYIERVSSAELRTWHRPRISALVEAGVDFLAVETIPAAAEATAILELIKDEFPTQKTWVSFSCKDENHISHGEPFREAVTRCRKVSYPHLVAVGVNCLSPMLVTPLLSSAQGLDLPFIVYPNSGETWNPKEGWTNKEACLPLQTYLPKWVSLGAKYVGGCCRTTADDIKQCREFIDANNL